MKKLALYILAGLFVLSVFAGCSGKKAPASPGLKNLKDQRTLAIEMKDKKTGMIKSKEVEEYLARTIQTSSVSYFEKAEDLLNFLDSGAISYGIVKSDALPGEVSGRENISVSEISYLGSKISILKKK